MFTIFSRWPLRIQIDKIAHELATAIYEVSCNQLSSGEPQGRRDAEILFQCFGRQLVFHRRTRKRAIQPSRRTPSCPSHLRKNASSYSRPRHGELQNQHYAQQWRNRLDCHPPCSGLRGGCSEKSELRLRGWNNAASNERMSTRAGCEMCMPA
jgi:hypothetical protein